jgi:23S rRNA pseudouridine1911/1915/1917 synthase
VIEEVTIPDDLDGARADRALAELLDVGVSAARRLMAARRVRIDGRLVKKGDATKAGGIVTLEGTGTWLVPAGEVAVLFADDHVVIVDKPAGMACHPLVPGEGGTVVDAVVRTHADIAAASPAPREAGLVHRLDTGTSGCLAIARDSFTWARLREAFARGDVVKRYLALVEGYFDRELAMDASLVHDARDRRRMRLAVPGETGLAARTTVTPLAVSAGHSLVDVAAAGGRRHQVRAHLAAAGYPLVGDVLYGAPAAEDTDWHLLHACVLVLPGMPTIRAGPPPLFLAAVAKRGLHAPPGAI